MVGPLWSFMTPLLFGWFQVTSCGPLLVADSFSPKNRTPQDTLVKP